MNTTQANAYLLNSAEFVLHAQGIVTALKVSDPLPRKASLLLAVYHRVEKLAKEAIALELMNSKLFAQRTLDLCALAGADLGFDEYRAIRIIFLRERALHLSAKEQAQLASKNLLSAWADS